MENKMARKTNYENGLKFKVALEAIRGCKRKPQKFPLGFNHAFLKVINQDQLKV